MIQYVKAIPGEAAHYLDKDTKAKYNRLIGGIAWPHSGQPAFALVLSEGQGETPYFKVLLGHEDHNALKLLETCKALEVEYPRLTWYGDASNRMMMQVLYEFNKGKEIEDKFKFQGAPFAGKPGNSGYYLPLIIEMIKLEKKRLSAGVYPKLANMLNNLDPETHLNKDVAEFPPLAALSYAVAYLLTYKGTVGLSRLPKKLNYAEYGGDGWQL